MAVEMEEKPVIKLAAICGSLRKASYNRGLLRAAMKMCRDSVIEGIEMEDIDISELPMMNVDLESNGTFPLVVEEFRHKIRGCDAVFFASPEYNYSLTPLLKNAIDWASRPPNAWADKPAAIVSVEGSGKSGQYHLRQIGVFLDIHFINKPELFLNAFEPPKKFDDNGDLIDEETRKRLQDVLLALRAFTLRLMKGKSY
ncbi:NAD(P)H:quinone oxidoreductase [Beta vulgaris subsp. vulgaris]|uniref:NAD(P)H:quinone oxidoreductase n=1 Tax=Beta vulgaris subsp. vulgaris TaxID=3555 RepID=UPI00203698AB|nr:NAD(P)H:quinone oxidoreductase [Beta vulgaris subsp. vulgaris]